jgi:hypothetical protein
MSWQPRGNVRDLASLLSRSRSGASPARDRYAVPRRPCDCSARTRRRGRHHAHSSARTAHHATTAQASSSFHGRAAACASAAPSSPIMAGSVATDAGAGQGWLCVLYILGRRSRVRSAADEECNASSFQYCAAKLRCRPPFHAFIKEKPGLPFNSCACV